MQAEIEAMEDRAVFTKFPRQRDKHVIGLKWIYGFKFDASGDIIKQNAWLVAQGYNQIPGVDFNNIHLSCTIRIPMYVFGKSLLNFALTSGKRILLQLTWTVTTNEVYTEQAPGFITAGANLVYCANKTLYGMMAGVRDWEKKLSKIYNSVGY